MTAASPKPGARVPTWALVAASLAAVGLWCLVDDAVAGAVLLLKDVWVESATLAAFVIGWLCVRGKPVAPVRCKEFEAVVDEPVLEGDGGAQVKKMLSLAAARKHAQAYTLYLEILAAAPDLRATVAAGGTDLENFFSVAASAALLPGQPTAAPVLRVVEHMREAGVDRSTGFYDTIIRMLAWKGAPRPALEIHELMRREGVAPAPETACCLLTFLVEVGDVVGAVGLLREMQTLDLKPSVRTYMFLLKPLREAGSWEMAHEILLDMRRRGVDYDTLCLNVVLGVLNRGGQGALTAEVYAEEKGRGRRVDCISLNTAMVGLLRSREPLKAVLLMEDAARTGGIELNARTYQLLLDLVRKLPDTEKTRAALRAIEQNDKTRDGHSEALLGQALSRFQ